MWCRRLSISPTKPIRMSAGAPAARTSSTLSRWQKLSSATSVLGYKSIAAALLHDVVEDTDYTVDDIRSQFGDKIASLVDGLTKIKNVLDNEDRSKKLNEADAKSIQAENFKRILLTLNDDVRVVLIKLADRLHNCRTIEFMPEYKRDKILSETISYSFLWLIVSVFTRSSRRWRTSG